MDPSALLLKTSRGVDACNNRASSDMPSRARAILMLVDEKSSAAQLIQRLSIFNDVQDQLQWLYQQGYIASAGQLGAPAPSAAAGRDAKAKEALHSVAAATAGQPVSHQAREILEQELIEFLGPMASLECEEVWPRCQNTADAVRLLAAKLNDTQAAQFMQRVGKRLGA